MDIDFRFAQGADAAAVADQVIVAGDGLFEFLLDGLVPGVRAREFMRMAVNSEDSPLHFGNAILAEQGERMVGVALGYPSALYGLPPILDTLVPRRRIDPLRTLFNSKVADSWYLNTLVISDDMRGQGLGRLLTDFCAELGKEEGLTSISLHAWADNAQAMAFYAGLGFEPIETVPVDLGEANRHQGGMVLLKAPLPLAV